MAEETKNLTPPLISVKQSDTGAVNSIEVPTPIPPVVEPEIPEIPVELESPLPETFVPTPEPSSEQEPKNVGLDIGTMNLVAATINDDSIESCALRNVFLEIDNFSIGSMDLKSISHIQIDESVYILSQDAYNFANIFNKTVSRPMNKGLISSNEIDGIDIISTMIKKLIGDNNSNIKPVCCYSVPANPLDSDMDVSYHKNVFERIVTQLNYIPLSLNEATAVIYSECEDTDFTGIGISFGAGMTNIAVVFKAVPVLTFSLSRGGDWIDLNAGNSIGTISNRVNLIKEKENFNLTDYKIGNKKEQRIREALIYYYKDLINYVTSNIINSLSKIEVDFPEHIPIIVSGGTSLADGFIDLVTNIFNDYEFPFTVKEVKTANNQLTAVAEGCLIKSFRT